MRYLAALLVLVLGYLLTGVTQVRPGERALVRRFGRVVAAPGPGLWLGLPAGMDRVDRVPVDWVRRVAVGYQPDDDADTTTPVGQMLTGDHNLVNVRVVLSYSVDDEQFVAFVEHADRVDGLISRAAEAALAEWLAGRGIDDILIQGKSLLPGVLVERTQARIAPYGVGVRIRNADVTHLFPPREVKDAFDEVTRAEASVQTRVNDARQEAARSLRSALAERFRQEREAEAYVSDRLRQAKAEAERFELRLAQYRRLHAENPEFLQGLWWDEIGKLFARLRETGRIDFLDQRLGADGLDITVFPPPLKK
jgi:membrane protease subunit HflK